MKIAIVGSGYVGLVSGACFSEMGIDVVCVDKDDAKIKQLQLGIMPIYEPDLEKIVRTNSQAGRLKFTTDLTSVIDSVDVIFSAVGTPPDEDGSADLSYVLDVARTVGRVMTKYSIIVTKSTVPVGTSKLVRQVIEEELAKRGVEVDFDVVSNPEFLKEGAAVRDFMSPDRVVVGVESERAKEVMSRLYQPFMLNGDRMIFTDIPSAEMIKYAANAMLATRISFMNEIANLCEVVGADINMVRKGIGSDPRIGNKFLYAGCGYGGSCFPKDVKALIKTAHDAGCELEIIKAVEQVNERQKEVLFNKFSNFFDGNIAGKCVAVWGLSFKPETDDMREAPSLVLINKLLANGCKVQVHDPISMDEARRRIGDERVVYCENMYDALLDADALMLITEWRLFRMPSWQVVKRMMHNPLVIDGRNIYDKELLETAGFTYLSVGRG